MLKEILNNKYIIQDSCTHDMNENYNEIDSFEVGRLVNLQIASPLDDSKVILPAMIIKSYKTSDDWPVYDIAFLTRWVEGGNISGYNIMREICVWRYLAPENSGYELPTKLILDFISTDIKNGAKTFFDVDVDKIHYIEDNKKIKIKEIL